MSFQPFLVSPRNSPVAVVNLMKKTNCSRIVTILHAHHMLIDGICKAAAGAELTIDELPTLSDAYPMLGRELESDPCTLYPPPPSRPDVNKPAIYVHSSGSTGLPKPIAHSYRIQVNWMAKPLTYGFRRAMAPPRRMAAMSLPPFHIYGLVMQLYIPFASPLTAAVFPPRSQTDPRAIPVIPTSDNIIENVIRTGSKILTVVPAFLEQWVTSPEAVQQLKKLDYVIFGGGPLPVKVGDALCAAGVTLGCGYGATEFGIVTSFPDKKAIADGDWGWFGFPPDFPLRWVPQGDGTYECQVLSSDTNQVAVENLPDVKGYATSDLFIKHPTKDLWTIVGRKDDVIILASGEKTVPAPMETIICSSPLIQGAIMFGRERHQVGILIDPRSEYVVKFGDEKAVSEFKNKIWPVIEEANKTSPGFSRILKEMIILTKLDKPLARTAKGTVQRKVTLKDYDEEINALYNAAEASSQGSTGPSTWTMDMLEPWLIELSSAISSGPSIDPNADLFVQGFDSLSAASLRNGILRALRESLEPTIQNAASLIPPNFVFENPTIKCLSARIFALVHEDGLIRSADPDLTEQRKMAMNAMIEKYSVGPKGSGSARTTNSIPAAVVLLNGSTGGLGSYLLAQLLENPAVKRVYALNRPSSSTSVEQRQRSSFIDRDLRVELLQSEKIVYVEADVAQIHCGLPDSLYAEIRDSITVIIHNAWRVDFNLPLSSFESSICATRSLVDLAWDSPRRNKVRLLSMSSISSAFSWDRDRGPFPEEIQPDPSIAVGSGYGESKYVSERIIIESGLHATSLRIGQIAGGSGGSWATTNWVPNIVKTSIALGAFPEAHGLVSWLRPEDVARAVIEIAFTKEALPPALNIVNPRGTPWWDIMTSIRSSVLKHLALKSDDLPMIPFAQWFNLLEKKAETSGDLVNIPGIKLLEFFRTMSHTDRISRSSPPTATEVGGPRFSTVKAQCMSQTMAHMQPISEAEAQSWVQYWISKGFF
ncbi:putative nonribosomal peptide synthetase [Phlebopus sp. FC_14]|nr:putative nonribosomal peptide synthetase [Phlebopus sp. FC_14]